MSIQQLEFIERSTGEKPSHSIIWLHGLGADGHDFEAIVPELKLPTNVAYRFIFPHAPFQRITINKNQVMRGWYDIRSSDIDRQEDFEGINDSTLALMQLIEAEIERGIASENIVIAGFSQGGAIALNTGLRYHSKLAGIMALSSYLPSHDAYPDNAHDANKNTPIFMAHGKVDEVIAYSVAEKSHAKLASMGYPVEWHSYDIGHGVGPDELDAISQWLQKVLN
ncbi:MAG: alpha/beta hydrolase [Gammaproteobacteria bacterium]|nr:alpha/beta hydrolase [Gammaproteobacteria bacterium]